MRFGAVVPGGWDGPGTTAPRASGRRGPYQPALGGTRPEALLFFSWELRFWKVA